MMFTHKNIIALVCVFFSTVFTCTASTSEEKECKALITAWSKAHNDWQFNALKNLYAPRVLYYCNWSAKEYCIKDKIAQVSPSKAFRMRIASEIKVKPFAQKLKLCTFIKEVQTNNGIKEYPAYLIITKLEGKLRILAESDEITDRNSHFVLDEKKFGKKETPPKKVEEAASTSTFVLYTLSSLAVIALIVFGAKKRRNKNSQQKTVEPPAEEKNTDPQENTKPSETSNKEKGNTFEKFIINKFDKNYFTLLDRTNDEIVNGVHALSRSNPDFLYQFEFRGYIKKFAVECTYRSKQADVLDIKAAEQLSRYKTYAQEQKVDVYIILGLAGTPQNPKELFIIPLQKAKPKMTYDELKTFARSTVNRLYFSTESGLLT